MKTSKSLQDAFRTLCNNAWEEFNDLRVKEQQADEEYQALTVAVFALYGDNIVATDGVLAARKRLSVTREQRNTEIATKERNNKYEVWCELGRAFRNIYGYGPDDEVPADEPAELLPIEDDGTDGNTCSCGTPCEGLRCTSCELSYQLAVNP